jgi:hypothetical protein
MRVCPLADKGSATRSQPQTLISRGGQDCTVGWVAPITLASVRLPPAGGGRSRPDLTRFHPMLVAFSASRQASYDQFENAGFFVQRRTRRGHQQKVEPNQALCHTRDVIGCAIRQRLAHHPAPGQSSRANFFLPRLPRHPSPVLRRHAVHLGPHDSGLIICLT